MQPGSSLWAANPPSTRQRTKEINDQSAGTVSKRANESIEDFMERLKYVLTGGCLCIRLNAFIY
jgi:hypothetical protein